MVVRFGGGDSDSGESVRTVVALVTARMVPVVWSARPSGGPAVRARQRRGVYIAVMTDHPIGLHRGGPPETVLPADAPDVVVVLETAAAESDPTVRLRGLQQLATRHPRCVERVGGARRCGPRRDRGLCVLPGRVSPRSRSAAPIRVARGRATSGAHTPRTEASFERWTDCAGSLLPLVKPTKPPVAQSSCISLILRGFPTPRANLVPDLISREDRMKRALLRV